MAAWEKRDCASSEEDGQSPTPAGLFWGRRPGYSPDSASLTSGLTSALLIRDASQHSPPDVSLPPSTGVLTSCSDVEPRLGRLSEDNGLVPENSEAPPVSMSRDLYSDASTESLSASFVSRAVYCDPVVPVFAHLDVSGLSAQ